MIGDVVLAREIGVLPAFGGVYTELAAWIRRFGLLGDFLMSLPRDRVPDLSLEPLDNRDGMRRRPFGEAAQVRTLETVANNVGGFSAAYQALIDAVFTAPGATEWLNGMWKRVTAILAERDAARPQTVARDAIRAAGPGPGRL